MFNYFEKIQEKQYVFQGNCQIDFVTYKGFEA